MEYEHEPIRGLPGELPEGERILWQGAPNWRVFTRTALHSRWIGGYFALIAAAALLSGSVGGMAAALISAALVAALMALFAGLVARTTVYTITNRRIVLRIGVALTKCINLPLSVIGSAELREHAQGFGDIALLPTARHRLGYAMLWPHARPLKFSQPQPMFRSIPDAAKVAELLAAACDAVTPVERTTDSTDNEPAARMREATA